MFFRELKRETKRNFNDLEDQFRYFKNDIYVWKQGIEKKFHQLECKHCACKTLLGGITLDPKYACCKCGKTGLEKTYQEIDKDKTDLQVLQEKVFYQDGEILDLRLKIGQLTGTVRSLGGGTRKKGRGKR